MSAQEIATLVALLPIVIYLVVRLGAAAFFKSKQTYDNQQRKDDHGSTRNER